MAGMNQSFEAGIRTRTRVRQTTQMPRWFRDAGEVPVGALMPSSGYSKPDLPGEEQPSGGGGECPKPLPWWIILLAALGAVETVALLAAKK